MHFYFCKKRILLCIVFYHFSFYVDLTKDKFQNSTLLNFDCKCYLYLHDSVGEMFSITPYPEG